MEEGTIIEDRVVRLERVLGRDLLPNPANWRTHPQSQRDAMRDLLTAVGFAGAALAFVVDAGEEWEIEGGGVLVVKEPRLALVDGHLRAEMAPDQPIPVLVTDLTREEGLRLLRLHDPAGALAVPDHARMRSLAERLRTGLEAADSLLRGMVLDSVPPLVPMPTIPHAGGAGGREAMLTCPECGTVFPR